MAFSQQTKPLTTTKILSQAIKLPTKSTTLILPILLLSFLASSAPFAFVYLTINPLTADLTANSLAISSLDPKSPEYASIQSAILNHLKEFLGTQAIFFVFTFIVSSIIDITTINVFAATFNNRLPTFSDLLRSVCSGLKGPMITKLYIKLLSLGYVFPFSLLVGVFVLMGRGSVVLITSGIILGLAGLILYLYLSMLWSVSVVISVVEDGCYGLEAISEAGEIMTERREQGIKFVLTELVILGVLYAVYYNVKLHISPSMESNVVVEAVYVVVEAVYVAVGVLACMFELAVSMVLYCDCRRSKDGKTMATEGGFVYASVPTASYVEP